MTRPLGRLHSLAAWVLVRLMAALCGIGIDAESTAIRNLAGLLARLTANSGILLYPVTFQCSNHLGILKIFTTAWFRVPSSGLFICILVTKSTFTVLIGPSSWSLRKSRIALLRNPAE